MADEVAESVLMLEEKPLYSFTDYIKITSVTPGSFL
jgi:DNA-binding ferritin-like protein